MRSTIHIVCMVFMLTYKRMYQRITYLVSAMPHKNMGGGGDEMVTVVVVVCVCCFEFFTATKWQIKMFIAFL